MTRLGRSLSQGALRKVTRGRGPGQWVLDWRDAQGRRRREALSTDRRVAERLQLEILRHRDLELAGLAPVEGMAMPLAQLRDAYLADLGTRATPAHVVNTTAALARMLRELRVERVRDVRAHEVLQVRARLLGTGLAPRTVNLHVDRLRAMLAWAVSVGLIAESPLRALRRLPDGEGHQRYQRRALTEDEIQRLLTAAEAEDAEQAARVAHEATGEGRRERRHRGARVSQEPLFRALLETGARYGELVTTTWADLDLDVAVLTLRAETTKARRERQIPLRRDLVWALVALQPVQAQIRRRQVSPSDRIFLSPEGADWPRHTVNTMRILDRLLVRAGIPRVDVTGRKIDLHALRHTAATRLARAGVPLAVTQRVLGHSDPKLTARVYTHLDVEDLREAIERVGNGHKHTASSHVA